jgi:hypothetical protein
MTSKISYDKIEQELGIDFPQGLRTFYEQNVNQTEENEEVRINCKHLINDWKYSYNFNVLKSEDSIIKSSKGITNSINAKVLCFAWSYETVEKDTGLFYMKDGKIYGYSGNFSNNYQPDLITDNIESILNPNSENRVLKISEIIGEKNWFYGDQESADNVNDYERVIRDYFIKTSDNRLILQGFRGEEIGNEKRKVQIQLNNKDFEFELKTYRGWIDPAIINSMNNALRELGIEEKIFVEVHDRTWGQELGVAFADKNEKSKLIKFKYSQE